MKRNAYTQFLNRDRHKPFFLYGIKGVGKTYLCNEYVNDIQDSSFIYFSPSAALLSDKAFLECTEPVDFLSAYFSIAPEILLASSMIFDDTEKYSIFAEKLFDYGCSENSDWILVSEYDYLGQKLGTANAESLELFPMQFDEYLSAFGFDWYVSALQEHFINKKRIPDILHDEIISDFDEYLYVGGMPQAVNEYLSMKSQMNIASLQRDLKNMACNGYSYDSDLREQQIISVIDRMLKNKNQKFKFSEIREGASIKMFEEALNSLVKEKKVLIQREIKSDRNFKLFYPEFSFLSADRSDGLTQEEYYLRAQNYLVQTFLQKKIKNFYWESGNRASLDFLIDIDSEMRPVNLSFAGKNDLRSVASYISRGNDAKALKIADTNFVDNEYMIPIYMLFAI